METAVINCWRRCWAVDAVKCSHERRQSATCVRKLMFSPEKSLRAANCSRGDGLVRKAFSKPAMV